MQTNTDLADVGQGKTHNEAVEKYDQENGKYQDNVPAGPHVPNAAPAAPDPSPFKIGAVK